MAHKKAGGSTRNGRDSEAKRLGVKRFGGETVLAGSIIGITLLALFISYQISRRIMEKKEF